MNEGGKNMLLVTNIIVGLIVLIVLFVLFTFLSILSFTNNVHNAMVFTLLFFDMLFIMPFKVVNFVYKQRSEFMEVARSDESISEERIKRFEVITQSRLKLFKMFFRAGVFSYDRLMIGLSRACRDGKIEAKFEDEKKKCEEQYKDITVIAKDLKEVLV